MYSETEQKMINYFRKYNVTDCNLFHACYFVWWEEVRRKNERYRLTTFVSSEVVRKIYCSHILNRQRPVPIHFRPQDRPLF
jgi:hypothetical protein